MNKIININVEHKKLFKNWLQITNSFHNLTPQQQNVLASFLYYHFKYKNQITNVKILWKVVFDYDTKRLIKEELNIKDQVLQNVLTSLRKKKIIRGNRIISTFIPEIGKKDTNFKIVFNFNIINE